MRPPINLGLSSTVILWLLGAVICGQQQSDLEVIDFGNFLLIKYITFFPGFWHSKLYGNAYPSLGGLASQIHLLARRNAQNQQIEYSEKLWIANESKPSTPLNFADPKTSFSETKQRAVVICEPQHFDGCFPGDLCRSENFLLTSKLI